MFSSPASVGVVLLSVLSRLAVVEFSLALVAAAVAGVRVPVVSLRPRLLARLALQSSGVAGAGLASKGTPPPLPSTAGSPPAPGPRNHERASTGRWAAWQRDVSIFAIW